MTSQLIRWTVSHSALFLLRKSDFVKDLPEEYKATFVDSDPISSYKLDTLKTMIKDRFPVSVWFCIYD